MLKIPSVMKQHRFLVSAFTGTFLEDKRYMKHFVIQKNKSKCTILDFSAVVIITSSNHTGKAAVGKKFSEGI